MSRTHTTTHTTARAHGADVVNVCFFGAGGTGVEERQMELVNNEKYEQLFIRFVGPFQLGDTKDHVPGNKMPFKVKL